jgi:hypothetical protein
MAETNKIYVDKLSKHEFQLLQAKGLPAGEQELRLTKPATGTFISANDIVCGYSQTLAIVSDAQFHNTSTIFKAYAVNIKKGFKALPTSLEPSDGNLGLFCNGCLPIDPYRSKHNAYLCVAFSKSWAEGVRICVKAKKRIYGGDEIVLDYGKRYNEFMMYSIQEKKTA